MLKKYAEWEENKILNEMSARRSFGRTISKFVQNGSISTQKPIAILTAFRADIEGTPQEKLEKNRLANHQLGQKLTQMGFSYYPILGFGQEEDSTGNLRVQKEESFIVQPRREMPNEQFLSLIKILCFNDNSPHRQWGATVKLPGEPAVLMHHAGDPQTPDDYNQTMPLGNTARVRKPNDAYYSQMAQGQPRQFVIGNKDEPA